MSEAEQPNLTAMTVQLLSAYVSNNSVPSNELADLISTTRAALAGEAAKPAEPAHEFVPAVTVRKSLASRDHILSMIDGKPYKSLKRHLSTKGLSPAEYRARYNLPKDYPMVAPGYSEQRREVAKRLGLGRRSAKKGDGAAEVVAPEPAIEPTASASSGGAKSRGPKKASNSAPKASTATPESKARPKTAALKGQKSDNQESDNGAKTALKRGRRTLGIASPASDTPAG
jgi:predicted transcriptional regulator